jgi:hypothetical protein
MKRLQVKGLSRFQVKKCQLLRGGNLKTLHLIPTQRKNRSYPTLETVTCHHDKTFSATPIYSSFDVNEVQIYITKPETKRISKLIADC